jgi:hypothetical protein
MSRHLRSVDLPTPESAQETVRLATHYQAIIHKTITDNPEYGVKPAYLHGKKVVPFVALELTHSGSGKIPALWTLQLNDPQDFPAVIIDSLTDKIKEALETAPNPLEEE